MKHYLIEPIWDLRSRRIHINEFREALESSISPTSVNIDGENIRFLYTSTGSRLTNPIVLFAIKHKNRKLKFTAQLVTKRGKFLYRGSSSFVVAEFSRFSNGKIEATSLREKGLIFESGSHHLADRFLEQFS